MPTNLLPNNSSASPNYVWNSTDSNIRLNFNSGSAFDKSSNQSPGFVSKSPHTNLLYSGATAKFLAFWEPFYANTGHISVGYDEAQAAIVKSQVTDMASRGITGVISNWFGPNQNATAIANLQAAAEAQAGFSFCMMLDKGAPALTSATDKTTALINIIKALNTTYAASPAYLKVSGRPVLLLQGVETIAGINWATVRSNISGLSQGNPLLIFNGTGGFSTASGQSDGAFGWTNAGSATSTDPAALAPLKTFYTTGKANPSKLTFGVVYKGFNNTLAKPGTVSTISQQAAQTWLQAFGLINSNFSSTAQIPFVIVTSWNDYEQGTEVETGISSGLQMLASISGNVLTWVNGGAAESTVVHYNIYDSTDNGVTFSLIGQVATGVAHSFTISGLAAGTHQIAVVAVGKASIQFVQSNSVTYTVSAPTAPGITSLTPNSGTTAGGTSVTLTGTNFVSGATVAFGGTAATSVVFVNATTITCVTPAHSAGAVGVVVTNPNSLTGTLTNGFSFVTPGPPLSNPQISSVSPNTGSTAGGTSITIGGTGFVTGCTVTVGGVPATSVAFVSSTSVTCVTPAGAAGTADVTLVNPDNQRSTLAGGFTYATPAPAAPTLSSISPVSGPIVGGTSVTVIGTNFQAGIQVSVGGTPLSGLVLLSSTQVVGITPAGAAGAVDVVAINPDAQTATLVAAFTYIAPPPSPTIDIVVPNVGPVGGGNTVAIKGTNFRSGLTATIGGNALTHLVFTDSTLVSGYAPAGSGGLQDVVITNPSSGGTVTLTNGYEYQTPAPPPPTPGAVPPSPPLAPLVIPPSGTNRGVQEFYYTRTLPARSVGVAQISTAPLTPEQLTDVFNFPFMQGTLGIWKSTSSVDGPPDWLAPDFNQATMISGSDSYFLDNQFFEITNVRSGDGLPLFYQHPLGNDRAASVAILDMTGAVVNVDVLVSSGFLYHSLDGAPYQVRFVDSLTGSVITQLLHYSPVLQQSPFNPSANAYTFAGRSLQVSSPNQTWIRFLHSNGYQVLPPYNTPPNTPWYARVRFGVQPPAMEWARQVFLPQRPYMLAAWVPGEVFGTNIVGFERGEVFYDQQHLPDLLVYDKDYVLKYALEGTDPSLPRRRGTLYPWKRGLIQDLDSYKGRVQLGVSLAPDDIVFGFYSYAEHDVLYRPIDLNPFTNPDVKNKVVQFYYSDDPVNFPFRNIFHEILDPTQVNSELPSATRTKTVFGRLVVGASVGPGAFDITDIRVRGGGLAPAYRSIPEAANFWDLGYWDGKPYPVGGALVVYLPASILETLTRDDIAGLLAESLPAGALPIVRFYNQDGSELN